MSPKIDFTEDEVIALVSALDGVTMPVVPDLEVYEDAVEKLVAAYEAGLEGRS